MLRRSGQAWGKETVRDKKACPQCQPTTQLPRDEDSRSPSSVRKKHFLKNQS